MKIHLRDYLHLADDGDCTLAVLCALRAAQDGDTLYLSGLVSEDMDTGELVAGDMTTETRQVLNNLERILKQYGSDMSHVLRVDVLLSDFSLRNEMNAEYIKHFPQEKIPARVCYGGVDLAAGCKIEIVAIAKKA